MVKNEPLENLAIEAIAKFLVQLTHTFAHNHAIDRDYLEPIRLFVNRSLFPRHGAFLRRLVDKLSAKDEEGVVALNAKFTEHVAWMSPFSEQKIGIEEQYCRVKRGSRDPAKMEELLKEPLPPWRRPGLESLGSLSEDEVNRAHTYGVPVRFFAKIDEQPRIPDSQIYFLSRGIQAISKASLLYAGATDEMLMSADSLFPIVVYCVIHSGLTEVFSTVRCLETLLPEEAITRGQTGFCLSLFKAAVQYILSQTKEDNDFVNSPLPSPPTTTKAREKHVVDAAIWDDSSSSSAGDPPGPPPEDGGVKTPALEGNEV